LRAIINNSEYRDVYGDDSLPGIRINNWKNGYLYITYKGKFIVEHYDNDNNYLYYKEVPDELISLMDELKY
jgi:hypothetical protein